jgi:hypothetical protein
MLINLDPHLAQSGFHCTMAHRTSRKNFSLYYFHVRNLRLNKNGAAPGEVSGPYSWASVLESPKPELNRMGLVLLISFGRLTRPFLFDTQVIPV